MPEQKQYLLGFQQTFLGLSGTLRLYLGENAPVKILTHRLPDIPGGFDFDAFTSDALFTRMSAKNGQIVLPDGMSYRMMILPGNGEITLEALKKIADLVNQGISVYGTKARYSEHLQTSARKKNTKRWPINYGEKKHLRPDIGIMVRELYTGECLWKKPSIKQVYNPTLKWSMLLSNRKKCGLHIAN